MLNPFDLNELPEPAHRLSTISKREFYAERNRTVGLLITGKLLHNHCLTCLSGNLGRMYHHFFSLSIIVKVLDVKSCWTTCSDVKSNNRTVGCNTASNIAEN